MTEKIIGILGGMGPEATVELFQRIVTLTPAKQDQDHYRIIIDNNPKVPDRTAAIQDRGPDPQTLLIESARTLERAGVGFIVIPCNTAHHWLEGIRKSVGVPVVDMVGETARMVSKHKPAIRSIGLLATDGTLKTALYQKALAGLSIKAMTPDTEDQKVVMEAIYKVKAGDYSTKERLIFVIRHLLDRDVQGLILGCTELPLLVREGELNCPIFDPISVLAKTAVKLAGQTP